MSDPAGGPGRHRLHLLTPLFTLLLLGRNFWPALLLVVGPRSNWAGVLFIAVLAALIISQVVGWYFVTYELADEALIHRSGIVRREERTMPYDRVQHVTVDQKARHRLFGVGRLQVSSASGGSIELDVLTLSAARQLKAAIEGRRQTAAPADPPAQGDAAAVAEVGSTPPAPTPVGDPADAAPRTLVRLGIADLALAGITGARLLVVLGAGFTLLNYLDDLPIDLWGSLEETDVPAATTASVAAGVLAVAVVWFGLAALASVVTDFDFTMRAAADRLVVTKGLIARSEVTVPVHRVQTVLFHQSILRRWLARTMVRVRSAGGRFAVPLLTVAAAVDLLGPLIGCRTLPPLQPAPRVALRRAITRRVVPAALAALPVAWSLRPWGALVLLVVPAAAVAGWAAYRGMANGYDGVVLVARSGALYRTFVIVPAAKVQSALVTRSPLQRGVGLATLHVDVAGGDAATIPDLAEERAHMLAAALVTPTRARRDDDRRSRSGARPRG